MIKKTAMVLGVVVLCAIAFTGGYFRGKYVEAHKPIGGLEIQYWDASGHLQPTGYKVIVYDHAARLLIAGKPLK